MWVLIIILAVNSGLATTTVTFQSEAKCQAAAMQVGELTGGMPRVKTLCVEQ